MFALFCPVFFFRLKAFWPRLSWYPMISFLYVVMWCHAVNSFTSSGLKQHVFSNWTFSSTTKNSTCHSWKISGTGFPTRFAPIPAWDCSTKCHILPEPCFLQCTLDHVAGCISQTSHLLTPSNCNTCLCCQRVLKVPRFKLPPSGCFFAEPLFRLIFNSSGWNGPEKSDLGINHWILFLWVTICYYKPIHWISLGCHT